jgi:hypothetical protein
MNRNLEIPIIDKDEATCHRLPSVYLPQTSAVMVTATLKPSITVPVCKEEQIIETLLQRVMAVNCCRHANHFKAPSGTRE